MLYPLKFRPRLLPKIWGGRKLQSVLGKPLPDNALIGESWELYDFPPGVADSSDQWLSSVVDNGPLAGRTLHDLLLEHGPALHGDMPLLAPHNQFPILIKFLDARESLSVQVHPDAAYAAAHPGSHLKTEAWYIVHAEPAARLYKGLVPKTTRRQLADALAAGSVERLINAIPAKPGQCVYLPSGTIHALGAGLLVAEVQTPSDTTFRVFDFNRIAPSTGRPRPLHVEQALECINFGDPQEPPQKPSHVAGPFTTVSRLITCPHFILERVRFSEGVEQPLPSGRLVIWMILEGKLELRTDSPQETVTLTRGDTTLLPASVKNPTLKTLRDSLWLAVTLPPGHSPSPR